MVLLASFHSLYLSLQHLHRSCGRPGPWLAALMPPLPFTISTHNFRGKITGRVTLRNIIDRIAKGFPGLLGRDLDSITEEVQACCSTNPVDRIAGLFSNLFRYRPELSLLSSPISIYIPPLMDCSLRLYGGRLYRGIALTQLTGARYFMYCCTASGTSIPVALL